MARIACEACGQVFEGVKGECPRCARIDAALAPQERPETPAVSVPRTIATRSSSRLRAYAMPAYVPPVDEPPPPVVIPGPPSSLANTLAQSRPEPPSELDRFMAPRAPRPFQGSEAVVAPSPVVMPDEIECPRCAERIKARAKMCRFCQLPLDEPMRARSSGRHRALVEDEPPERRRRGFARLLRPAEALNFGKRDTGSTFLVLSVVFAGVGLLILPLIFGVLAIAFGIASCAVEGPKGAIGIGCGVASILLALAVNVALR